MALIDAIPPIFLHMSIFIIDQSKELDDIISTQPHWFIRMGARLFLLLLVSLRALSWLIILVTKWAAHRECETFGLVGTRGQAQTRGAG